MTLLVDVLGLELGRVELLVEVGTAFIRDVVESPRNALQEPVLSKFRAPVSGVTGGGPSEVLDGRWSEVPVLSDELKDPVIRGDHPLGLFAHGVLGVGCYYHMTTDHWGLLADNG